MSKSISSMFCVSVVEFELGGGRGNFDSPGLSRANCPTKVLASKLQRSNFDFNTFAKRVKMEKLSFFKIV